jgi:CRP-like cAMP-binding protein
MAGAMGFIDGKNHSATLRAAKDSHVLTLRRDKLESMVDQHPQLVYKIMKMIVRSVHKTLLRMNQQFVEMNNYIMREHGGY